MARWTFQCWSCHEEITADAVYRSDRCPQCDADVHVCLNCRYYDRSAFNECHEPTADFVHVKERANFCSYFEPKSPEEAAPEDEAAKARARLDALFKK